MKKTISIFAVIVLVVALAATTLQVSAKGGGPGTHGNGNGNGHSEGMPDQQGQNTQGNPSGMHGNSQEHAKKLHFKGEIATVDAAGMSLTLKDGSTADFVFDTTTVFKIPTMAGTGTAADLLVGMNVNVQAVKTDTAMTALKVLVVPGKPTFFHRVGEVTEYTAGTSISIKAKDGQTYTFKLTPDVKILPPELADKLVVGAWVTIVAPRDVTQVEPVVKAIVVHAEKPGGTETPEPSETPEP